MKKKTLKSLSSAILSFVLAVVLVFTSVAPIFAEVYAYGSTYISEVRIFSGSSLNEAINNCRNAGYKAVEKNLNHSNSGEIKDNGIYVIGYKTTQNPDEGITDISMLRMNYDYQDYTYGNVAERAVEKLGNLPDELLCSVNEFKENFDNGSPAALAACDVLNCYYIDELDNIKLGDYLVSGECTVDFIKKLLARSSTAVVSAFCNALVAGVSEYGDENWATRLSSSAEFREKLQDDANFNRFDVTYKTYANELTESLQAFSKGYHEAYDRLEAAKHKADLADVMENDVTEMPDETVEEMTTGGEIQTEDGDAFFLYAYDVLNQYNFDETTTLGDYIVGLGDMSFDTVENLRNIYPLVDSLTDGQIATMRLSGVAFSAIYLINDEGITAEAKKQTDAIRADLKEHTGSDSVSIWTGTDQTIYNQKVAVTNQATKANSAGQIYNTLTNPDEVDTFLSESMSKLEIIMSVIGIGYGITYLAATAVGYMAAFAIGSVGAGLSVWAVCCAGIGTGVFGTIFGILGCTFVVLNYVALVAMVVLLIALFVKWIYDKYSDDDAEEFSEIPSVVYDIANSRYVKYDAITNGSVPENINGANARRWNALYYTKSKYAGNPICSTSADDLITVSYNDNAVPTGYKSVKVFGEVSAANLNASSKSDSASIYMFFKSTSTVINEGEENGTTDKTLYLSKLTLSVSTSETAAKAALTKSGLTVLDENLTPVTKSLKQFTYLGFGTTTNPDDAITDIRISPRNAGAVYLYGGASYTSCGTTPTGDTLYYTSYKSAGVPILADILIKHSLDDVPEGYEPINMFCGGNAYNFNVGSELDNTIAISTKAQTHEHWNDRENYLYFKTSVSFTEGTEYISGIVLVAGQKIKNGGHSADDYISKLKLTKIDNNLTYAWKAETTYIVDSYVYSSEWEGVDTYMCYTTTHNPYRAIYGIKSYTSAPGNISVPAFLGSMSTGSYAVCDILFELPYTCAGTQPVSEFSRGIYETHSYQFAPSSGDTTGIQQVYAACSLAPEDYEDVKWSSSGLRGKGIYVLGPVAGGTPLTVDDIVVSSDATIPEGFAAVQDFKTPNRTDPHNLGYTSTNKNYIAKNKSLTPVYIYVRQEKPVEKKYISSICVSTYTLDKATGGAKNLDVNTIAQVNRTANDFCVQNLLSQCTDEIVPANIAIDYSESFYSDAGKETVSASYIGVSRTNSEASAITGIIRYVTDEKSVPSSIQVGGVVYLKAGDMILDKQGSYYLYYTTSAGANPGMPITSISAGSEVFAEDCATALSADSVDVAEVKTGKVVTREGYTATLYGDSKSSSFIHMAYSDTATMMSAVYVGHGKTKKDAQCNLLSLGCNMCIDMDVNKNAGGEYIYIGYTKYTLLASEVKKGVARYAVRDIVFTVGEAHQKTIEINGVKYKSAIDEFTSADDYDGTKAVSLNAGTGGKSIYMYYTTTQTTETKAPIKNLGLACKDYSMLNTDTLKWEHVFDVNGNRVNLNEGALATKDDGKHIFDNRMYFYVSRTDNSVKSGCGVDMSTINREFISYDVYMKGA